VAQLEQALSIAQQLAQAAQSHQAESTDTDKQKQQFDDLKVWDGGSNVNKDAAGGGKGILAMTAPVSAALASQGNISVVAGSHLDQVATLDSNHSVGKNLRIRVGQALSMFVQQMGMTLIAAAGKIQIQAQGDQIEIGASKRLHLYSLEEVLIEAPKITLRAQGAEIALGGGNIISQAAGNYSQKAANHSMEGPGNGSPQLPNMPKSEANTDEQFTIVRHSGKAYEQVGHEVHDGSGAMIDAGKTDAKGASTLLSGKTIDSLKMTLKRK